MSGFPLLLYLRLMIVSRSGLYVYVYDVYSPDIWSECFAAKVDFPLTPFWFPFLEMTQIWMFVAYEVRVCAPGPPCRLVVSAVCDT